MKYVNPGGNEREGLLAELAAIPDFLVLAPAGHGSTLPCGDEMNFRVELEQEADGRWIAEVPELPGVMVYGTSQIDAQAKVKALALRVLADRIEHGEAAADIGEISFHAA